MANTNKERTVVAIKPGGLLVLTVKCIGTGRDQSKQLQDVACDMNKTVLQCVELLDPVVQFLKPGHACRAVFRLCISLTFCSAVLFASIGFGPAPHEEQGA